MSLSCFLWEQLPGSGMSIVFPEEFLKIKTAILPISTKDGAKKGKAGQRKQMMAALIQKVNRTLFELETGIVIFGLVCQIILLLFKDAGNLSAGLWIGIITAFLGAIHMWWTLEKGLDLGEKGAVSYLSRQNIIRYIVIVLVLGFTAVYKTGNPLTAFLGVMGLKASAYMQPLTKKISKIFYGEDKPSEVNAEEPATQQEIRR